MKYSEINAKDYPIILSKNNPIDPTREQIDAYMAELEQLLDNTTGPFVFISYRDKTVFLSAASRTYLGTEAERLNKKYYTRSKGTILISNGVIQALILKAIRTIYKPLNEIIFASDMEDAYAKAKQLLAQS